jgi:transposase-like protein
MTAKRAYTPEEKLKIVLEGMNGTISITDLCRKYDLKPARFYYWKDQVMNSAPEIFENRGERLMRIESELRRMMRLQGSRLPLLRSSRKTLRSKNIREACRGGDRHEIVIL